MTHSQSSSPNEERLHIDPRLLLEQQGSWISDVLRCQPVFLNADTNDAGLEAVTTPTSPPHDLSKDFNSSWNPFPPPSLDDFGKGSNPSSPFPIRRFSLRPEAEEFVPSGSIRPVLMLWTHEEEQTTQHLASATPSTPAIRVLTPADIESSSNARVRKPSQTRGRGRTRSSPGKRPSQSVIRQVSGGLSMLLPRRPAGERLLSPTEWIMRDSLHTEDHLESMQQAGGNSLHSAPPWTPRSNVQTSRASSPARGPYFCNNVSCLERAKPWNTPSDLNHHQRKHILEHERPHACQECGKRFQYPKDVRRHRAVHVRTPVICSLCNRLLSRGDNLQRHIASQHNSLPQTPSGTVESSVASPASTTISSFSEAAWSDMSPSTAFTSSHSQVQPESPSFRQRILPYIPIDPFLEWVDDAPPTSVPMSRWHTR